MIFREIQSCCTESILSMNRQHQNHWPIYLFDLRTTTEPLSYLSHQLTDNQRPIDLYVSPINWQRQTHYPVFSRLLADNDISIDQFISPTDCNDKPIYLFFFVYWQTTTDPLPICLVYWWTTTYALTYYFSLHLDIVVR